ncbi:cysteine-rich CWC family protein [Celerinatantimonas sp. YJH-8]|uniref:cysteine-rich CWC family protein n=1 Tax=Celerinatantimonas sp. YJH-8 TaxID=3228714 RepID=UPI0038C1FBBF
MNIKPDPLICPLCGESNECINLATADVTRACWCNDPTIIFSEVLLSKIPSELRGKACICKSCVMKYQKTAEVD